MFMFRRKRNCLAKRLWKARIRKEHEVRSMAEAAANTTTNIVHSGCGEGDAAKKYFPNDEGESNGRRAAKSRSRSHNRNCGVSCCNGNSNGNCNGSDSGSGSASDSVSDEGLLRQTVLKRLKDNQLEMLVEAVEGGGAGVSTCVLIAKELVQDAQLLCCQIWRWPDLKNTMQLRRTPACSSATDPIYTCCNPYHWSRLCEPESSPPPSPSMYSPLRFNSERLKPEGRDQNKSFTTTATAEYEFPYLRHDHHYHHILHYHQHRHYNNSNLPYYQPDKFRGSLSTNGESGSGGVEFKENEWCKLAYWELSQRVGRLFPVQNEAVNVFWTDMQADGLCLEMLAQAQVHHGFSPPPPESVCKNRNKIGLGITLSLENDGVWLYNRSNWPVFVNSPSLDRARASSRTSFLVHRVPAGHCLRIFSPNVLLRAASSSSSSSIPTSTTCYCCRTSGTGSPIGPVDHNSVRISFVKGWGRKYSRQEITACPTWLEVLLISPCR